MAGIGRLPMQLDTMILGPVSVILLVLGIVEAAKKLGIEGNGSFILALVLGAVFGAYLEALGQGLVPAAIVPWVRVFVVGIGGALAATGLYDLGTGRNRDP